jgi:hypothetical protein
MRTREEQSTQEPGGDANCGGVTGRRILRYYWQDRGLGPGLRRYVFTLPY